VDIQSASDHRKETESDQYSNLLSNSYMAVEILDACDEYLNITGPSKEESDIEMGWPIRQFTAG
jgi:hypothetical protein